MFYRAKAPLRISFCGGGTDVAPYCDEHGGCVLSTTINMYAYATLQERRDNQLIVHSLDYDIIAKYDVKRAIRFDGRLDLVKAVLNRMGKHRGFSLFIHNDAPPGSGLGSSGTIGAMLVGVLNDVNHLRLSKYQIASRAVEIERKDLKIPGGRQDQYAAVFGGFNWIDFHKDQTVVTPLRIEPWIRQELQYHLLLLYTKKQHYSGDLIKAQVDLYKRKNRQHLEGLHALKTLAMHMKTALVRGQLREFGRMMDQVWTNKKKMNPLTTTAYADEVYAVAKKYGAIGGKVLGAGGGGYLLLFCQFDKKHHVAKAVEQLGCKVVNFNFEEQGLQIWTVQRDLIYDRALKSTRGQSVFR